MTMIFPHFCDRYQSIWITSPNIQVQVKVEESAESVAQEQAVPTASPVEIDPSKLPVIPPSYIGALSPSSAYAAQPAFAQGYGKCTTTPLRSKSFALRQHTSVRGFKA